MNKEDGKKKGISWFKSGMFNQDSMDKDEGENKEALKDNGFTDANAKEDEKTNPQSNDIFSKDNKDKVVSDVIVSLENMIKDRQLLLYKNKGLEEQLRFANDTISRLKGEGVKKDQLLQEKNKEIRSLEDSLTKKQMAYDQLLEDYKDYQTTANTEYEIISNQLNIETNKYDKLSEELNSTKYQNMLKISELEDKVRNLETKNQQLEKQYQKIYEEKSGLMETINDFTQRMTFSFSSNTHVNKPPEDE